MALIRSTRRDVVAGLAGLGSLALVPVPASATPAEMRKAVAGFTSGATVSEGRVSLRLPPIAENGNSVALDISVDSPMTEADHVRTIAVFAEANPLPDVVRFTLGPRSGRADVSTRIRLNDSQTILAIAEMSDGRFWSGTAKTVVTLAACGIVL